MPSKDAQFLSAAAVGRLVVALLFAANAVVYFVEQSTFAIIGIALAIVAATCGYFGCSAAVFSDHPDAGQKQTTASIGFCVLSGIAFLIGA
jgi:hypothetical protein